jgi:hypothetical protein
MLLHCIAAELSISSSPCAIPSTAPVLSRSAPDGFVPSSFHFAAAKGWRFHAHGGTFQKLLRWEDFIPTRSSATVGIRVLAAPVTQLDLDRVRGFYGSLSLPELAGTSAVGTVAQGTGIWKEGDRVVIAPTNAAGSWATHIAVEPRHLLKLPASIPADVAPALAIGPIVAYHLLKAAALKPGDALALSGEETFLGQCIALLAKARKLTVVSGDAVAKAAPKFGISLKGGKEPSILAASLATEGQLMLHIAASDEAPVFIGPHLSSKSLQIRPFAPLPLTDKEAQEMLEEIATVLKTSSLAGKIARHSASKLLEVTPIVAADSTPDCLHVLDFS